MPVRAKFCAECGARLVGARPISEPLSRWQVDRAAGARSKEQAPPTPRATPSAAEARAAVQALEDRRGGTSIMSNTLLLVGIVLVFVVVMIEMNKDAPKEVSPFEGGPAPGSAMGGASSGAPSGSGVGVDGRVSLDVSVTNRAPSGATLFVTVRNAGSGDRGPPLAVKKIESPSFPLTFHVDSSDVMMAGMPFTGPFDVSARLDSDGNAMTRDPNDLVVSRSLTGVMPGAKIELVIDMSLAEAGSKSPAPAPAPSPVPVASGPVQATVELSPQVGAAPAGTLFVFARAAGVTAGPPMAVKRISNPSFPVTVQLGPGDVMIPGAPFLGPLDLEARLDQDGNVMSRAPGDLTGPRAVNLSPGATGVKLVLDTRQQ